MNKNKDTYNHMLIIINDTSIHPVMNVHQLRESLWVALTYLMRQIQLTLSLIAMMIPMFVVCQIIRFIDRYQSLHVAIVCRMVGM
jgi:hypothetical protein